MFSRYLLLVQYLSVFSMNFSFPLSRPVFRTGMQRYALFFNFQNFFQKFSKKFQTSKTLAPVFSRTHALTDTRFSNGSAKVRLFSLLPNFSAIIFAKSYTSRPQKTHNSLNVTPLRGKRKLHLSNKKRYKGTDTKEG